MSVTGLCQICEAETAEYHCERCGRVVGVRHYDEALDLCTECAAEVRRARGGGGDGDEPERRHPDTEPYDPTGETYQQ